MSGRDLIRLKNSNRFPTVGNHSTFSLAFSWTQDTVHVGALKFGAFSLDSVANFLSLPSAKL